MNGGWLGRVCTTPHLHVPYVTHSTSASFVLLLYFLSVFMCRSQWFFADMGSVLTKLLRTTYGATGWIRAVHSSIR